MKCINCGTELPDGSTVCFECGAPQNNPIANNTNSYANPTPAQEAPRQAAPEQPTMNSAPQRKCTNCGAPLPNDATVCFSCGAPQQAPGMNPNPAANPAQTAPTGKSKSKVLAAVLAFLWGAYGIDQFYLGFVQTGVLRIVATVVTCGIGGVIWGIVDCVRIATGTINKDASGNPIL